MDLLQLLNQIDTIAQSNGISQLSICGGASRDRVMQRPENFADIDLTTGDKTIHQLGAILSKSIANSTHLHFPDGHDRVMVPGLKLDFSSNFIIPGADNFLKERNLPTDTLHQEMISRDFTCNSLLMSMDLTKITDPLQIGIKDIQNKIIDTCLSPNLTLRYDHKRIIRIIYMGAKLDFNPSERIVEWVKQHRASITSVSSEYLSKKLLKAIKYSLPKTVELLDLLQLWEYIPAIPELIPYLSQRL